MEDAATYNPNEKEQEILRETFGRFGDMRKAREKKYRYLGDRTPQAYIDESEKRFIGFAPPKDVTEQDWQANVVMGITRNAVLSQISKVGSLVPEVRFRSFTSDGFFDSARSQVYGHIYRWSLARENADKKQQFISLGNFVRGNACVYEGWEDEETEVDLITDTEDDGSVKSEKKKISKWGPKRQLIPVDEFYFPNYFLSNVQDQTDVIWRQVMQVKDAANEFSKYPKWKYVKGGYYSVGPLQDPFFRSSASLTGKQVEVIRHYVSVKGIGKTRDRYRLIVGGVLLLDIPLPFNHKLLPFSWTLNEPLSDSFMIGCSLPFKVMNDQDTADMLWNLYLDKNQLSALKPVMTDDPDPNVRTYLSPGGIMQFTKGSTWTPYPIEGVTSGEFGMLQEALRQAKEDAGTVGGAFGATSRGGKVTARQAVMMEEEAKRILGISMTNMEQLEKDIAVQRIANFIQFAPGSGKKIEADDTELSSGQRGRFVGILAKTGKAAEAEKQNLSLIEMVGEMMGRPTEAVAIKPDWFDLEDRLEAECVPESSYLRNKSIEQATELENVKTLASIPQFAQQLDWEEELRDVLKVLGKDPKKLIKPMPAQPPSGQEGPPGAPGGPQEGPPGKPGTGPLTSQLAGAGAAKSLQAMTGV